MKKDTWSVGLNHGGHDASAALLRNGKLFFVIEQERLSRNKRAPEEAPALALCETLKFAGIKLSDISTVGLGSDHDALAHWLGITRVEKPLLLPYDMPERLFPTSMFGDCDFPRIRPIPHHLAHAASAFGPSGFAEAAVLVIDAMGEDISTSIWHGAKNSLRMVYSQGVDVSLGFFYEAASEYAGLERHEAGKLMGLAAYGRNLCDVGLRYSDDLISWGGIEVPSDLSGRELIEERIKALQMNFATQGFPYSRRGGESILAYADFAASAQAALEVVILALARKARELTGASSLALAGGVALNCTANGRLSRSGIFKDLYVQPMSHDAGTAVGAAIICDTSKGPEYDMEHAFWGPDLLETDTISALASFGYQAEKMEASKLLGSVAECIANSEVVVWAQGRAEVGPRSLGARSFLGDPRNRETLVRLNVIKQREMWRPLAPSVRVEDFTTYFIGEPNAFMIIASDVRKEWRAEIPAVVHVDGSARPQAVSEKHNSRFYQLIGKVGELIGIPIVVNTSLNVGGEPVANSAYDILRTFGESQADAFAIGDYFFHKKWNVEFHA